MLYIYSAICVILAYLIGSINFAVIFAKALKNVDVRDYGSGNAGATNVLRVLGRRAGFLIFLLDAVKGFAASAVGYWGITLLYSGEYALLMAFTCGLACMLGHCWPVFFQFRGGKGVAISVGIFALCCPIAIIIGLIVFAILLIITKMISVGSITATVVVIAISIYCIWVTMGLDITQSIIVTLLSLLMGVIIIGKHKQNIIRIIKGQENKFSLKKE